MKIPQEAQKQWDAEEEQVKEVLRKLDLAKQHLDELDARMIKDIEEIYEKTKLLEEVKQNE